EPRTRGWTYAIAVGVCLVLSATPVAAQRGLLLQGIFDAGGGSTNATANLSTKNTGNGAGVARLQAWGAIEPLPSIVLYAQGEAETGSARAHSRARPRNGRGWG